MPLPLTREQVGKASTWLLLNFGPEIRKAVEGKPYDVAIACAIACKETGPMWVSRIDKHKPAEILALQVGDASGDFPNTSRKAFPRNTAAFRSRYGDEFTEMLIGEANKARTVRGFSPAKWVYKGYGLFQYDLQNVEKDEEFFRKKLWYNMDSCLERFTLILDSKFKAAGNDEREGVRRYNGAGASAEEYADHVMTFVGWCRGTM
ncbi:MAG: hypothetical protein IT556_17385 [Acetobacteraceae bacterium]|nr:hypothetical protein [Acetobacteraceae bacterium]